MKAVNIGLLGLGTVGGGTVEVLKRNATEITRRAGRDIVVTMAAVRDTTKSRGESASDIQITTDPFEVVNHPDIDIVVELVGGETLSLDLVLKAIENGKHVVTANKALIALHGNSIFEAAQAKGTMVAFEAAVAGGISIIKSIREGLSANRIEWLAGIINGTSNYILTKMEGEGRDFSDVLAEAQSLGYAEADPTFDIEGTDAAHKLTILASIAFGIPLQFNEVFMEGITGIDIVDINQAAELGYRIKHLGIARRSDHGIELRVHPTLIPKDRLIANINGVMNGVLVYGDAVGPTLHYGAGAGAEPTASAVVADIVDVVRTITADPNNRVPHLAFQPGALASLPILPITEIESSYYLRLRVTNQPGVLASVTSIFGEAGISINTILQKGADIVGDEASIIIMTDQTKEESLNRAINQVSSLSTVLDEYVCLRIENLS